MSDEIAIYRRELQWLLDQAAQTLQGYPPGRLHWRPATGAANSAAAIIHHVVSSTRVYVLGFACGQAVTRDRAEEFDAEAMSEPALLAGVRQLAIEVEHALVALPAAALDGRMLPPQALWGAITPAREISAREAIVMSVRHLALHLGELRLTRDLAALPIDQRAEP